MGRPRLINLASSISRRGHDAYSCLPFIYAFLRNVLCTYVKEDVLLMRELSPLRPRDHLPGAGMWARFLRLSAFCDYCSSLYIEPEF